MINYLAALGWNDGTDKEIYSVHEIIEGFDVDRVNASPSMFDLQKLKWVNGQHIRALEPVYLEPMLKEVLEESDLLGGPELSQAFLSLAVANTQEKMELLAEAVPIVETVLSFPFQETVDGDEAADIISDNFSEVTAAIVASFDAGEMPIGEEDDFDALWKKWVKALGKNLDRKGKRLFMPVRLAVTGTISGGDIGTQLRFVAESKNFIQASKMVDLPKRIEILRSYNS